MLPDTGQYILELFVALLSYSQYMVIDSKFSKDYVLLTLLEVLFKIPALRFQKSFFHLPIILRILIFFFF